MAHPFKNDAAAAHTAKMRNMTDGYGSASGPANNITSPQERLKGEGGEKSIGFGINSDAPRTRADRSMRRTSPANPLATYAKGGRVNRASGGRIKRDSGGDVSPIEEANKDQAMSSRARGGKVKRRLAGGQTGDSPRTEYARGGRTGHKKGSTHVNVIVAPQGGAGAGGPGGGMPMMPPRPVPPVVPPPGGMPPPGGPPPGGGMPPRPPMAGGADVLRASRVRGGVALRMVAGDGQSADDYGAAVCGADIGRRKLRRWSAGAIRQQR